MRPNAVVRELTREEIKTSGPIYEVTYTENFRAGPADYVGAARLLHHGRHTGFVLTGAVLYF